MRPSKESVQEDEPLRLVSTGDAATISSRLRNGESSRCRRPGASTKLKTSH